MFPFPTPTERTAVVLVEGGVGAALSAGPATAVELEITGLLIAAFVALLTATAVEALAIVGVLIWATALLVPVALGAWHRVRRLRSRPTSGAGTTRREVQR